MAAQAWTPPASDAVWTPPASDAVSDPDDTPRVGWVEENLAGPSELIASTVANIPHAAAHSAVDLYRRVTGGDTEAPDPAAVRAIEVPTGAGARQLVGDIKSDFNSAFPRYTGPQQPDDTAIPDMSPTTRDIVGNTLAVAGDVGNIAPVAGLVKGAAGKVLSATADVPKPAAPIKPTFTDDVPSPNTPPPNFTPPKGAPAASAAAPVTDEALTKSLTATPADDAAAQARFASLQRLKEDGLKSVRESAVSGDRLGAATDYPSSKLDKGVGGNPVAEQLTNEKQALTNGIDRMIAGTGGSVGTDSVTLGNRGETILRPLDDLAQKFRDGEKAAYAAADAKAGGSIIDLDKTANLINNRRSVFRGVEGAQLLRDIKSAARELGMWDDATNELWPSTVQKAEQLRQYVSGGAYDPKTAGAIREFKDTLADDVTKSAGNDVYQRARALRAERARTLDDPDGIAKILDSSGPHGINRKVPVENVADTLTRLPDAQFHHIIDTIEGTRHADLVSGPQFAELRPKADAALAEIRAHMLQRAKAAALPAEKEPWAAQRFTDYLQANRAKLTRVLKPSELEQLESLNRNGHYLDIDRRYSGAAVQAHNLATRGKMLIAQHGTASVAASAGGFIGGHVGATGGALLGEHLGGKWAAGIERAANRKAWAKRVRSL